jgi:hypothetical protein
LVLDLQAWSGGDGCPGVATVPCLNAGFLPADMTKSGGFNAPPVQRRA